jgi:dGTPase
MRTQKTAAMKARLEGNTFYNDFDLETWEGGRGSDYRTPFQQDRDRLVHTAAFRRLQGKTQVFLSGEYDFYRTRLTHSLEVAQIGRSICQWLKRGDKGGGLLRNDLYIDPNLVEAICLAHDLGNPPFGHAGEKQLHALMLAYGGFEGNAQTLRLLTETIYPDRFDRTGLQPTRAFLDGVLKYKTLLKDHPQQNRHYLYDEQKRCVEWAFASRRPPRSLKAGEQLNKFRSIECQIMDWADNTAYCWSDLADAIRAGFIDVRKVEGWARNQKLGSHDEHIICNLIKIMQGDVITRDFSMEIGKFVTACKLRERQNFMSDLTNRYRFELEIAPAVLAEYKLLKKLAVELVFRSAQVQQLEFKGNHMLRRVFEVFANNYIEKKESQNLLPAFVHDLVEAESNKRQRARLICDHIAGMTDGFAQRTYRRLFDPSYGSLADLV